MEIGNYIGVDYQHVTTAVQIALRDFCKNRHSFRRFSEVGGGEASDRSLPARGDSPGAVKRGEWFIAGGSLQDG